MIQSQSPSGFALCGTGFVTVDAGAVGPVGLPEHAAGTATTDTSITKRIVRDIMGSDLLGAH